MKKIILFGALFFALTNQSNAGFHGLTHHSRANCGNNESISWDWKEDHEMLVQSEHININNDSHMMRSEQITSWRVAVVHWGEGLGGWTVKGGHYIKGDTGSWYEDQQEVVTDCSIYNGWWDKDK